MKGVTFVIDHVKYVPIIEKKRAIHQYGWLKIDLPSLSTDDPSPLCSGSRPPILFDQSPRVVGVEVKEGVIGSSIIHLFL